MCNRNYFGSSDSVSSSETYVEETTLSASSGEEEVKSGGEFRWVEKEMEGGQNLSVNKTKGSFSKESATKSNATQSKASIFFTNERNKGQKEPAEVAFLNQIDQAWPLSHNYPAVHDDLAKLVVDVECIGSQSEPKALLGQEGKHEAQEGIGESLKERRSRRS